MTLSAYKFNSIFTAFDQAVEFRKNRTVPSNWKTELKEESSSSEAEEEEEDEKEKEDKSSEEEASILLTLVTGQRGNF